MNHGTDALLRIGRNTRDLGRAVAFYRDALGCTVIDPDAPRPAWTRLAAVAAAPSRCAHLALGTQQVELTEFPEAPPYPGGSRGCDAWFQHFAVVTSAMEDACRRVLDHGATPISRNGPQRLPPAAGSVTAFKFRDPDGHPLELLAFPPAVGDPRWHCSGPAGPNLGIDHSAVSVRDVARSIRFHELLGLAVVARAVNHGPEQQRLDNLAGVAVEVVAMQARSRTPHLELLAYRRPRGRPAPPVNPTAVAADRLQWNCRGLASLLEAIASAGFADAVLARERMGNRELALLRTPAGHLLLLGAADA